jgi:hypothetical protein
MVSPNARRWMFQLRSLEFECMDHIPSIGSIMTPFPYVVQVDESVLAARGSHGRAPGSSSPGEGCDTLLGVLTDRDMKRAPDPSLGLSPKAELFVRDVFVPDATSSTSVSRSMASARRQLLLPVSDNYFCRRRVGKGVTLDPGALGSSSVAGR